MPLLNSLCCGCRSRKTSLITAFYSISMAVTCLSLMLLQHSANKKHTHVNDPTLLSYLSLGVYGLLIVSSFVLVAGANLSKLCVSIPWFLNMVAVVGFEAATSGAQYVMAYHQHKVYFMASICVQCYCSLQSVEIEDDPEDKLEGNKDVYTIEETLPTSAATHAALKYPNSTENDHISQSSPMYQRLPVDTHLVPDMTKSQLSDHISSYNMADNADTSYKEDNMMIKVEPLLESYSNMQKNNSSRTPGTPVFQVTGRKRGKLSDALPLCDSSANYAEHSFETTPLYQRHLSANQDESPWHNPAVGEEERTMLIASEEEIRYDGVIEPFDIDTL